MKKTLSIVVVLTMLTSMLCGISVSADDSYASLNNYSMSFDNGNSTMLAYATEPTRGWATADSIERTSAGGFKMQLVADPVNSDNTVLKLVLNPETYSGPVFAATTAQDSNIPATGTIPVGSRIVYTFRYYLETEMDSTNNPQFAIDNGGRYATATTFETVSDKWHDAKLIYTNVTDDDISITQANLRFQGSNASTLWKAADGGERVIYFDDFKAIVEKAPPADKYASLNNYSMSFDNGNSTMLAYATEPTRGWATADTTERTSGGLKMQLVADPVNSDNTVLKLVLNPETYSGPVFAATTAQDSNIPATGTIPVGSRIVYTFRYYLETEMDSTNNPQFAIDNGGRYATATTFETVSDKWHDAKLIYTNVTDDDISITQANLRFQGSNASTLWKAADGGERVIYFDDFKAIVEKTPEADKIASLADYSMSFEHGNSSIMIYAKNPNGYVTADAVKRSDENVAMQLVADPEDSKNTVLKLTQKSGKHSGPIFTNSIVAAQSNTAAGTVSDGSRIVFTFKYYVNTAVSTANPKLSIDMGGGRFATTTAFDKTTGKWNEAKLIYSNNTGADISITQANIKFQDSYDSSTLWAASEGDCEFYFDDFRAYIEKTPEADKIASLNDYSMSFEHGNSSMMIYATSPARGYATADAVERADSNVAMQLAADPKNSKNTALKLTFADAAKYNGPYFTNSTTAGQNALATATIPAGSRIVYTFRYYLETEMASDNNPQFSIGNSYKDASNADKTAFAVSDAAFDATAGEWHEATLVYTNDTDADIAVLDAKIITRGGYESATNWKAADGGERVIYFDDFTACIEEAPAPAITETTIEKVDGGIKVSALDAINGAKLIFVTYDGNGRMLAANLDTEVTLAAKGTQIFPIPEGYENAKVMLWNNLSAFIPLADAIQ